MAKRTTSWYQKRAQYLLGRISGRKLFAFKATHHGIDDTLDISALVPLVETVLDVGANTGQSAIRFRAAFPNARIISFEPITKTFHALKERTKGLNVECHQLALGQRRQRTTMFLTDFSVTSSLIRPPDEKFRGTEEVEVETLDEFVAKHGLSAIDLLKVDAEGFDLEVLAGAEAILAAGIVKFVLVEVGFHPGNSRHVLFDDVRGALMKHNFRLFGIYAQTLEWTGEPSLLFANAVFCYLPDLKLSDGSKG